MNELVVYPVIGLPIALIAIFGFLGELEDLSYQASDKTLQYTEDAVNALDCAFEARPLTECSPDITGPEFSEEIARTNALLTEMREH